MIPPSSNALDRHARFIAAFCEDLASGDYRRAGKTPRADAAAAVACIEGRVTSRRCDRRFSSKA